MFVYGVCLFACRVFERRGWLRNVCLFARRKRDGDGGVFAMTQAFQMIVMTVVMTVIMMTMMVMIISSVYPCMCFYFNRTKMLTREQNIQGQGGRVRGNWEGHQVKCLKVIG